MEEESGKVLIVLFSGTVDRLLMMASLAWGAAAMGQEVVIFLQTWGAYAFLKGNPEKLDQYDPNSRWSEEYKDLVPKVIQEMKRAGTASWYELLQDIKEDGLLKIYVCSTAAEQMGVNSKEAFDGLVDDITGVVECAQIAETAMYTYYI